MIDLQPAAAADLPEVVALTNWAYRGTGPQSSWTVESYLEGERTTPEALAADLAGNPEGQILLWRDAGGELQGHFWLEPAGDDAGYIGLLCVRPDRQDQKLGRNLLAAAEDLARARGYKRRGYALTGETRPFPYGDDRFGRPLRDDLCFMVLERAL
jgi:GNAT superfamily N-acetyltransferase